MAGHDARVTDTKEFPGAPDLSDPQAPLEFLGGDEFGDAVLFMASIGEAVEADYGIKIDSEGHLAYRDAGGLFDTGLTIFELMFPQAGDFGPSGDGTSGSSGSMVAANDFFGTGPVVASDALTPAEAATASALKAADHQDQGGDNGQTIDVYADRDPTASLPHVPTNAESAAIAWFDALPSDFKAQLSEVSLVGRGGWARLRVTLSDGGETRDQFFGPDGKMTPVSPGQSSPSGARGSADLGSSETPPVGGFASKTEPSDSTSEHGAQPADSPSATPYAVSQAAGDFARGAAIGAGFAAKLPQMMLNPSSLADELADRLGLGRPFEEANNAAKRLVARGISGEVGRLYPGQTHLQGFANHALGLPLTADEQAAYEAQYSTGDQFNLANLPLVGSALPTTHYDEGLFYTGLIEQLPGLVLAAGGHLLARDVGVASAESGTLSIADQRSQFGALSEADSAPMSRPPTDSGAASGPGDSMAPMGETTSRHAVPSGGGEQLETSAKERRPRGQRLYRAMEADGSKPRLGNSKKTLGPAFPGGPSEPDLPIVDGQVHPGPHGLSTNLDPMKIPPSRRPPDWGGSMKNAKMFWIDSADVPPSIELVPDTPRNNPDHLLWSPEHPMHPENEYTRDIWGTQMDWTIEDGPFHGPWPETPKR